MSEFVRFTKDGLRLLTWNSDTSDYDDAPYNKGLVHLRSRCEIAEGVTLRDIMAAVDQSEELKLTIGEYSWCWDIDKFQEEVLLPDDKTDDDPLTQIEISRYGEIWDDRLEISDHFGANSQSGTYYGISYTPLNRLADLPVVLITKMDFHRYNKHDHSSDTKIFTVNTHFSLLEVLDAIYWDISFAGGPEEKVEFLEMLGERAEEAQTHPERLIPFDALKEEDNV